MTPEKLHRRLRATVRRQHVCRYTGRAKVGEPAPLTRPRSAGKEETSTILVAKFLPEVHAAVSAAGAGAVLECH